jgi:hypothetical protein
VLGESDSLCTLVEVVFVVLGGQTLCLDGEGGVYEAVAVVEQAAQVVQRSLCERKDEFADRDSPSGWPGVSAALSWEWAWVVEARASYWTSRTRR